LLVLVALVGLQFDRLSVSKISTVAAIEYSFSDAADDSDDDTFRIAGGKAIVSIADDISALHGQSLSSQSGLDKAAQPNTPDSRHPRGPPLSV
jgi:hypothetical protein